MMLTKISVMRGEEMYDSLTRGGVGRGRSVGRGRRSG